METDISTALATLQIDPDNTQALTALKRLQPTNGGGVDSAALGRALTDARRWHRERGDFELWAQLIDLELPFTTDPARRAELLHEKGRVLADELLSEEAAQAALREAIKNVPGHPPSVEGLAQMSLIQSNWQPIASRYLQQAEAATDKTLASSLFGSVAEMYIKYRPDAPEGETYLRRSLELDPKNRRSGAHFERLLRRRNRPDELLALLSERASLAPSRDERALAEVASAELSLKLGKPDQALVHFRKALEANPSEAKALRPVVAALNEQKEWPELGKVLEAASRSKRADSDELLLTQLATIQWKRLDQIPQAELNFRKVRRIDPASKIMVDFYREFHGARDDLPQLLAVLAGAQKADPDPERRISLGIEMAKAAESRPQNAEKVIDIWKGLLRLRPHLPEAFEALRRLYERGQKWNALLDLLKDDLESLADDAKGERIARYLEIAEIYRDRLNLEVMVVNTYLNVLQIDPDHPAALGALAARYESQGRWSDLIQILTRQADKASDPATALTIHRKIAALWMEKLSKHQNAVPSLEKILDADPTDAEARGRLREIYTRGRSWRALVELTRREAPLLPPAERRERLAEAARVVSERIGEPKEAINLWNLVLAIDEHDADALAALVGLYDRERRWAALAEVLDRQRATARDATAEVALLERRGVLLYEKLGAGEAAIEVFKRVQELQPQNVRATRALREIYAQAGDFAALERLYADQGNYEDLCETLATLADRTPDAVARTRMLERIAILASEKLHQPERALKAYERILAADPGNVRAAEALVPLYRTAQKWPRLLATYEVLAGKAADGSFRLAPEVRLGILRDARQIAEQRMGSKGLAFQWAARCFEVAPTDKATEADLERLAGDADEWDVLAELYAKRLTVTTEASEKQSLLRRLLKIASARLHRAADARRYAEALLVEVPGDAEAQAALEQILTQGQAWPDLAALLHARAARTGDVAERTKLLLRIAQIEEEKSRDLAAAARTFAEIADLDAGSDVALKAIRSLARIQEAREDWPALIATLRRELGTRPPEDHEDLLLRIGGIEENRTGDLEATFAAYRDILAINTLSAAAVAGLERIAARGSKHQVEIASLALPFYQRTDNAPKQAAALEVLAGVATDPVEKIPRLERLVALYAGPLKNAQGAFAASAQIFEFNPGNHANREALVRFGIEVGAAAQLAERMRALASQTSDLGLRRDLLVEVAELHEQRLGNAGAAEKVYREILEAEPLHAGAFRALSRLFRDGERWPELRGLLEARQERVAEAGERIDLLAQIAEIDETVLDDADHAVATYEKMLEIEPADPRAYKALDRHYAARERWRDREQLLERRLKFAGAGEVHELEYRRAEMRLQKFGDAEGALDILESIVKTNPTHAGARVLLEKVLQDPEHKGRAARILEPLYEGSKSWRELVGVLQIQREGLEGPAAAALLARVAALEELRLNAPEPAFVAWRAVLVADPTHKTALAEAERLAESLGRWTELVDLYQEAAFRRDASDLQGRADLLSRAAKLYAGRIGNRRAAIDAWKLVLNLDPESPETGKPAADALEGLYSDTGNVAALVRILRQQVGWADTLEARKALLFRVAELEETSLEDSDAAVATLRTILDMDPASVEALDELERLFEKAGQPRQRVEILRRRVDIVGDLAARQALWRRIGEILEKEVGDPNEAIAANLSILDESPVDAGALDSLARLYEQQGRHADRLEILERRLTLVKREGASRQDVAARVDVLRRLAELSGGPLANPTAALGRWREILALSPGDPGALAALEQMLVTNVDSASKLTVAEALETHYESAGRFAELAGVLQIVVEAETDARARVATYVRLAQLQETKLRNPEAAFAAYGQAIRDALGEPQLPALLDAYERLAGPDKTADVIALFREIAPDVLDETVKSRLDRVVAEGALRIGNTSLAAECYRRILDRAPDDAGALAALEQIYRTDEDFSSLYDILIRQAEQASDPSIERKVRSQMGALAEQKLERPIEAIAAYERVFELARDDRDAIFALDRLYAKHERWSDLVQLIEKLLERRMPEAASIELRFRLAEIRLRKLGDSEKAIEQLRAVLRGDPDHAGSITMLEAMLEDLGVQGAAAELLEPVYAGRQDWPALIHIGEIRLQQVEDPAARLALTKRIARLYEEQIEDYDSALKWYGKVFQENPSERINLDQLVRIGGRQNRWQDVAMLLSDTLSGSLEDSPALLEVARRAAEIFDVKLNNQAEARQLYRRLYEARPGDHEIARLFEDALERWEAWQELRELLDDEASREADLEAKKLLLRRSARLDEENLLDSDRAARTLREIIDLDPTDRATPTAADELERLLAAQEQWHDLGDHLEAQLGRAGEGAERDALALRLAQVLEEKIGNITGAVDRYAEILERSPAHRDAITALERLLASPDERPRVAQVLEPVYRHAGNWSRLVSALEAQLETVDDRDDRVRLLREVADIQQRLARVDNAFDSRARAWLVDVSNAETLSEIEALAMSAKLYGPLVQTLQKGADLAGDADLQAELWAMSARVLEAQLQDPGEAIEAWRHALDARPDDQNIFVAMERLLAAGDRQAELAEVLEKHLGIVTDPTERKEIAKRTARIYDLALKQRDRAIEAWQVVMEIDDTDMDALDALGRLYVANLAWRDLAGVLQRKIEITTDPTSLRLLRLTSARLFDERLNDPQEALGQLRSILDAAPGDRETLELMDRLLTREAQHADLLDVLDRRAAIEAEPPVRDAIAMRAAGLLADELSDVDGAIGRYRQIVERSPANSEARFALWKIARGEEFRAGALAALEPLLRAENDWADLIELLDLKISIEESPSVRVGILAEMAQIEETQRRSGEKAFAAWSRAFAEETNEPEPRAALERLAAANGDWFSLAKVYEDRLAATYDAGLQRQLTMRLGELYEGPLDDAEGALDFYRKAGETPGDEAPVLEALDRVLTALGRHAELAEVLQRKAEVNTDPMQQAEILVQLGGVRLRHLDEVEGALSVFRDALEKAPDNQAAHSALYGLLDRPEARDGALDILEPLAENRGDYLQLVALYEYRLGTRDDRNERAAGLRRIAEILEERLSQPEKALEALGRALVEEPVPGETVDAMERVAALAAQPIEAARLIEAVLSSADPTAARELALRAARLYETDPAQRAAAERLYVRVLEDDPENADALGALEAFHRSSGNQLGLAEVLERRAAMEFDPAARRERLTEAARLRESLGDVDGALAAWQTLREAEEGDGEVLSKMARLFEAQGKMAELCDVLAERARFENEPAARAATLIRLGEVRLASLEDLDGAADAFREALDSTPDDPRLLGALETIEVRREDWSTLQEVLLRRMGTVEGEAQVPVLFRIAKNAEEKLSDIDQAVGFLHQILEIDGTNGMAYLELERILRANERWYDLVDVLGKHADAEAAAGRRPTELALRVAIADVWEKNLDSTESATEALEKILEVAPEHVGALLSLARIHEAAERWEDATAMLERAAVAVTSGSDAAEIHYRNAQIRKAQGATEDELDPIYIRALEADGTHIPSLLALETLARAKDDHERLVQLLELRLDSTADPVARKPLLAEIAMLYRTVFANPASALAYLEQLGALAPDDVAVAEELADAYVAVGRTDDATVILERLVADLGKARRGKEIARVLQRLGAVAEAKQDFALAHERYTAAYKLDPGHPGTLAALGRLALGTNDLEGARRYFRSLLLQTFDEKTAGITKASVYLALGQIHLRSGEGPKARNMFERGLETDPKNEELRQALASVPK
ncbi:MAG TPA: tetratricopeptide repeat protein [Polyangia bacterium]|jgi:tetratricopeptide (TPR) repeat protein